MRFPQKGKIAVFGRTTAIFPTHQKNLIERIEDVFTDIFVWFRKSLCFRTKDFPNLFMSGSESWLKSWQDILVRILEAVSKIYSMILEDVLVRFSVTYQEWLNLCILTLMSFFHEETIDSARDQKHGKMNKFTDLVPVVKFGSFHLMLIGLGKRCFQLTTSIASFNKGSN